MALVPAISREPLIISDLILSEVVTIIGRRSGGKAGQSLYTYFTDNCGIVCAPEHVLRGAMPVFLKYNGNLSLPDAVFVYIMRTKKIDRILSFDSDFDRVDGIVRVH